MPYSTLRDKKTELIRKARDGSVFLAPITADAITSLTTGTEVNEVQTVTITGTPTGGSFRLTYAGSQTATILYNAIAATVQTALEGLPNLAPGDVTVTGGPGPGTPYVVTFGGTLAAEDVAVMTATHTFTGGTAPAIAVTTTTPGSTFDLAALPTGYEDLGWTSTDGISYGRETEVSEVRSFGSVDPTRADITSDTMTMGVTAQETKLLTLELYSGADLSAATADSVTGEFVIEKPAVPNFRYYRVLGLFVDTDDDGNELYIARFMPRARITEIGEQVFSDGDDPIHYNFTFTGFEDSVLGFSHAWYYGGPGWESLLTEMNIIQAA
jgi:hypothetical protein